jgi:hypothetical protein
MPPLKVWDLRFLWRLLPTAGPLPHVFAVDPDAGPPAILGVSEHHTQATARLFTAGYLINAAGGLVPSPATHHLLDVLLWPELSAVATIDLSTIRNRAVLVSRRSRGIMCALVYGDWVSLAELDTTSLAGAAVSRLPAMQPGRHTFTNLPTSDLERAVRAFAEANPPRDRDVFVNVLRRQLGNADARDLFDVVRYKGNLSATFSVTAHRHGTVVRADRVVTVRTTDTQEGYVMSRTGDRTSIEPAVVGTVERRLQEIFTSVEHIVY